MGIGFVYGAAVFGAEDILFRIKLLFLLVFSSVGFAADVVDWSSPEGIQRLERARQKADFFRLANKFESQKNKVFCGPATAVILLNAFRLGAETIPQDKLTFDPHFLPLLPNGMVPYFQKYTQDSLFTESAQRVKSPAQICGEPIGGKADYGYQLLQFEQLLRAHGLVTKSTVVEDVEAGGVARQVAEIREKLADNVGNADNFAVVNFARKSLNQAGGGHLSPLGAYDERSDSFLVLDVNPNTANWFWVSSEALVSAMRTKDTERNRGYITVSDSAR